MLFTSSSAASLLRCIRDDLRTLQASLPIPQPQQPDSYSNNPPFTLITLPTPNPIASSLRSLGLGADDAIRCSSRFMREALRLKAHSEVTLTRALSQLSAVQSNDGDLQEHCLRAHKANFRRILNSWVIHLVAFNGLGGRAPGYIMFKETGLPDLETSSVEGCPSENEQVQTLVTSRFSSALVDTQLNELMSNMSLGISQNPARTPTSSALPTTVRYAHFSEGGCPSTALSLQVVPNHSLEDDVFGRYADIPVVTLVPQPRRRKLAGLPKRAASAAASALPSATPSLLPSVASFPTLKAPAVGTPPVQGRRRKIAPLPIRVVDAVHKREASPTPSLASASSLSPTTPAFWSQRSVSRTPSLTSVASDNESSSSAGPSTPTSSAIRLPGVDGPPAKIYLPSGADIFDLETPRAAAVFSSQEFSPLSSRSPMSPPSKSRLTTPGTFVQPYGAGLTLSTAAKTFTSPQASAPKARRVAGLPGSKKGASISIPKVFGFAAPSLPTAAPESAFGKFDIRRPQASASTFLVT